MAMIHCNECGKEISDSAERCPHCGCKTQRGQNVTQAKGLLINLAIVIVLMVLGVFFIFTSWSELGDHSSYYWESRYWFKDGDTIWAIIKLVVGIGFILGGIGDLLQLKNTAEELNAPVSSFNSAQSPDSMPVRIPDDKRKHGICAKCGKEGTVASCKLPYQFGDFDLCSECISRHKGEIR